MESSSDADFGSRLRVHIPRLRAFARSLTRDRSAGEDLAQETLMLAWRARPSFAVGTNMEAWLFRILRNAHVSSLRRARPVDPLSDANSGFHVAVDDPSAQLSLNDLRRAMNLLPPEQREALVLVGACGWTYEAAAAHAGCPVGTLKTRVFRARRVLAGHVASGRVRRDDLPPSQAMPAIYAFAREEEDA